MGRRIGIIAGGGDFPRRALSAAKKLGWFVAVAGLRGAASAELELEADAFGWFGPLELDKLVSFFKSHGISEAAMFGKVEHRTIFQEGFVPEALWVSTLHPPDLSPTALVKALIECLEIRGLAVLDPTAFLAPYFCPEGKLSRAPINPSIADDIDFGWPLVRRLADLDIGQTLVVKRKAVVAVEGMEGTDAAIRRGAALAGEGIVVLKAARTHQDIRVDVPAVGLETVRVLTEARAAALVIEAGRIPFFQKEEALTLADQAGLAILAKG